MIHQIASRPRLPYGSRQIVRSAGIYPGNGTKQRFISRGDRGRRSVVRDSLAILHTLLDPAFFWQEAGWAEDQLGVP